MNDFVAYPSSQRIALLILIAIAFVVLGLWMIGFYGPPPTSHHYPRIFVVATGWVCIFLFGLAGVGAIRKLFDSGEQLRVGASGIRWQPWSDQTIPWSEIANVTTWSFRGQKTIVLHLHDRSRFPGKGLIVASAAADRLLTGGDISILLTATNRSFEDAAAAIERFRPLDKQRRR